MKQLGPAISKYIKKPTNKQANKPTNIRIKQYTPTISKYINSMFVSYSVESFESSGQLFLSKFRVFCYFFPAWREKTSHQADALVHLWRPRQAPDRATILFPAQTDAALLRPSKKQLIGHRPHSGLWPKNRWNSSIWIQILIPTWAGVRWLVYNRQWAGPQSPEIGRCIATKHCYWMCKNLLCRFKCVSLVHL